MAIYNDISADRLAAGRLWTPALSFDLLSRDWSAICRPFAWYHVADTGFNSSGAWAGSKAIAVEFPAFTLDESYDPGMQLALTLDFEANDQNGIGNYQVRLYESSTGATSNEEAVSGTPGWNSHSFVLPFDVDDTLPSGETDITIQLWGSGGTPGVDLLGIRRQSDSEPNCYFQVRIV